MEGEVGWLAEAADADRVVTGDVCVDGSNGCAALEGIAVAWGELGPSGWWAVGDGALSAIGRVWVDG
jgi:hypothetical protein